MAEVSGNIISEDEYAYDIALRVARLLISQGATAYIVLRDMNDGIRDEKYLELDNDEICYGGLTIPLDQKKRLQQRAKAINNLYLKHKKQGVKVQRALLIHIDSRNKSKKTDVFFYHQDDIKESIRISKNMLSVFILQYAKHRKGRQYEGNSLRVTCLCCANCGHLPYLSNLATSKTTMTRKEYYRPITDNYSPNGFMKD
ncbi:hypothetical protein MASR1M65_10150 [Saprospiraceae bacterium]